MNKSNLLIVSGGYHKIEANYLQKPIIAIATQKHQDNLLKKFKLKTNLKYISYKNDKFENILNNYLNKFFIKNLKSTFKQKKIINDKCDIINLIDQL